MLARFRPGGEEDTPFWASRGMLSLPAVRLSLLEAAAALYRLLPAADRCAGVCSACRAGVRDDGGGTRFGADPMPVRRPPSGVRLLGLPPPSVRLHLKASKAVSSTTIRHSAVCVASVAAVHP
jgi:hypothetical protein